jgi:hypothetical protein
MKRGRKKGSGVIKSLDPTMQDAVAMRRTLWRGDSAPTPLDEKLKALQPEKAKLTVELKNLRKEQARWRKELGECKEKKHPTGQALANNELLSVEREINSAETALLNIKRQVEETSKQMTKASPKRAVFPWQEQAVRLIELNSYLHKKEPGSVVPSTLGSTISTRELQKQLRDAGYKVGKRQLQRFIHERCGVIGQQGQRSDLWQ